MDQTTDRSAARRSKRRRALFAVLLGASFATLGAGAMSLAIFTDSDASDGTWTSGTIILGVSPATGFAVADILPGDTGAKDIQVLNTGTGALRYAMTSTADNTDGKDLRSQLSLTIQEGTCAAPGTTLYKGPLVGAKFGDPAQGADTDDQDIAAGGESDLCFGWAFNIDADNDYQAASTTATFTFLAEQTAHNP